MLGLTYFRGGKFAEAKPIYQALVEHAPEDPAHHLNAGLVNLKLGDAEAAIVELEASRRLDPSQGRATNYLGLAYARGGRYREAYGAFLVAGQHELAREIEDNLAPDERAEIAASFARPSRESTPPATVASVTKIAAEAAQAAPRTTARTTPPPPPKSSGANTETNKDAPDAEISALFAAPAPITPARAASPTNGPTIVPGGGLRSRTPSGHDAILRAVATVAAASPVAGNGTRVAAGNQAPIPLSEFATSRLVRPDDGDHPFEVSPTGVLIVRVNGKIYSRTEGVDVTGGQIAYEPAMRRARGTVSREPFAGGGRPMFLVGGQGHLIAMPLGGHFTAVHLDDDILYLREDLVFAFEADIHWENGHIPGSKSRIQMVQFRGSGSVAFRSHRPLIAVKLSPPGVLYVDASAIAGWIGRVVPRAVAPAGGGDLSELFIECTGEGVILVDEDPSPPTPPPEVDAIPEVSFSSPSISVATIEAAAKPSAIASLNLDDDF